MKLSTLFVLLYTVGYLHNLSAQTLTGTVTDPEGFPVARRTKTSEVYNPATGVTQLADTVHFGNEVSAVVPLYTGKILMTFRPPQLFDPTTLQWALAADFVQGNRLPNGDHCDHELVLRPNGQVVAVGYKSFTPGQPGVNVEIYDPLSNTWTLGRQFAHRQPAADARLVYAVWYGGQHSVRSANCEN